MVIARDVAGSENWAWPGFGNILNVYLDNRNPAPPTLVAAQSTIPMGQPVIMSGAATDADGNATQQWLWYRGPKNQGPDEWDHLTTSSYAAGTGNTVVNYSFNPPKPGIYYFKSQVNDPYTAQVIINVAPVSVTADTTPPNAPTNLVIAGFAPTWATLTWTISNSTDVTEQHLYWQPTGGGTIADILLGINVAGTSATNLVPAEAIASM